MGENEQAKVVSLTPWDITTRSATGRRHAADILKRNDADLVIRSLSPLETYYAVKALGVDDATPYLAVIDREQTRALFDLDIWSGDRPDIDDLLVWLEGFKEASLERLQFAARAMDPELLAVVLRRRLRVAVQPTDDDPDHVIPDWVRSGDPNAQPVISTPDDRFLIAPRATDEGDELDGAARMLEEEERLALLRLISDFYRDEDHEYIVRALHTAANDLTSDLEESALRFRTGRLQDLGFPERHRAVEIYGPLEPDGEFEAPERESLPVEMRLPALHVRAISQGFLEEALRCVDNPDEIHAIEAQLLAMCNAALVADGAKPGNLVAIEETLKRARGYLELALTYGVPKTERLEAARERLSESSIRRLFRVGYTLTLKLKTRAQKLIASERLGPRLAWLEEPDRGVLLSLTQKRPMFSEAALNGEPTETRAFNSIEDLDAVGARLSEIEALAALGAGLKIDPMADVIPPAEEHSLELLVQTRVACQLIGKPPAPLSSGDLEALATSLEPDAIASALDALAKEAGVELGGIGDRLTVGLDALRESLQSDRIDPRFVEGVVRADVS